MSIEILFTIILVVGLTLLYFIALREPARISDARLDYYLDILRRPDGSLSPYDYRRIRSLFSRELAEEWRERRARLDSEFAARAIELELVFRFQAQNPGMALPLDMQAVLLRERVRLPDQSQATQQKEISNEVKILA